MIRDQNSIEKGKIGPTSAKKNRTLKKPSNGIKRGFKGNVEDPNGKNVEERENKISLSLLGFPVHYTLDQIFIIVFISLCFQNDEQSHFFFNFFLVYISFPFAA